MGINGYPINIVDIVLIFVLQIPKKC